jgi:DNA repair photolyase
MQDQREKDILMLCKAVLDVSANYWDNPNGAYETSCPYCHVTTYRGGGGKEIWAAMKEIEHKQDCAYLIAKDLSTNL